MSGALRHKRHVQTAGKGRGALHLEDHTVAIHTPKPPPPTTSKPVPSSFAPAPITPRPPLLAPYGSEELVLLDDEALRREERRHRAIQEEMLSKPFGPNTTGVSKVEPITPRPPRAAHNANMAARSSTAPQKRSASNQDQIAAQEEQELAALKRKLFNQLSSTASVPVPQAFATPDRGSTTTPCDVVVSVTEASPLHSGKKVSPSPASPSPKRGSYRTQATLKPLPSAFGGCSLHVGGINITTTIQAAVEKRERGTVLSDVLGKEQKAGNSSIDEEKSSEAKPGKAVTIQKSHNAAVAASFTSNLLLEALTRYETTHKQTASGIEKEKEEEGDDAATVRKTVQPVPCSEVSKDTLLLLPHGSLVNSLSGHTPLWRFLMVGWATTTLIVPITSAFDNKTFTFGAIVVIIFCRQIVCAWAYSLTFIFIARMAPAGHLGAMNGAAQSGGSLMRMLCPLVAAPVFAFSVGSPDRVFPFNHYCVFLIGAMCFAGGYAISSELEEEEEPDKGEQAQQDALPPKLVEMVMAEEDAVHVDVDLELSTAEA